MTNNITRDLFAKKKTSAAKKKSGAGSSSNTGGGRKSTGVSGKKCNGIESNGFFETDPYLNNHRYYAGGLPSD